MGKQHNRRIFAGFYKRYDGKYIATDICLKKQVSFFISKCL